MPVAGFFYQGNYDFHYTHCPAVTFALKVKGSQLGNIWLSIIQAVRKLLPGLFGFAIQFNTAFVGFPQHMSNKRAAKFYTFGFFIVAQENHNLIVFLIIPAVFLHPQHTYQVIILRKVGNNGLYAVLSRVCLVHLTYKVWYIYAVNVFYFALFSKCLIDNAKGYIKKAWVYCVNLIFCPFLHFFGSNRHTLNSKGSVLFYVKVYGILKQK